MKFVGGEERVEESVNKLCDFCFIRTKIDHLWKENKSMLSCKCQARKNMLEKC